MGNLKSGRGLFGEEVTQKYAKQALELVEEQVLDVAAEIREEEGAKKVIKVRFSTVLIKRSEVVVQDLRNGRIHPTSPIFVPNLKTNCLPVRVISTHKECRCC